MTKTESLSACTEPALLHWHELIVSVGESAEQLPLALERGVKTLGIRIEDVCGAVVSCGPGSFTGIRVGLSFLFGISAGIEARTKAKFLWKGVSSLEILAKSLGSEAGSEVSVGLSSTKTAGFLAISANSEGIQTLAFDVDSLPVSSVTGKRWYSLGPWSELEKAVELNNIGVFSGVSVEIISINEALVRSLNGMVQVAVNHWPIGFKAFMPPANYMKRSSVEEKMKPLLVN
ncbi:MAG: hypothetical protein NTV34_18850 [Proteobacteria bacterium]|nr:hypothetical protein [Pseudomonadota bacterium]